MNLSIGLVQARRQDDREGRLSKLTASEHSRITTLGQSHALTHLNDPSALGLR